MYQQALHNHALLHADERAFACDVCGRRFVAAGALRTHRRLHDDVTLSANHQCPHCPKRLGSDSNLRRHVRAAHFELSDGRTFACPDCDSGLGNSGGPKVFRDPSGLAAHRRAVHAGGVRAHACAVCRKRFQTRAHLKVHEVRL